MKDTGSGIIIAALFLGAAIMFGTADIAAATSIGAGISAAPGALFLIAGVVGCIIRFYSKKRNNDK